MEANARSLSNTARLAGLLYLVWTITGLYGMFYIPSKINMGGDAATTAQSILSNEFLFRTGPINDLISCTIWIVLVLVFYRMFKQVNERLAKLLVALVIVQIPVALAMDAFSITSLMIIKGELLKSFGLAQRQDVAVLFLKITDYAVVILEAFWGLWLFPLAGLVYRSGFLPRFLGVWLIITGVFYLAVSFTGVMFPEFQNMVLHSAFAWPAEVGEIALMLWLLIRGARPRSTDAPDATSSSPFVG